MKMILKMVVMSPHKMKVAGSKRKKAKIEK